MRDALEVLDLTLRLPVGGRTYVVRPPAAAVGIRLFNVLTRGVVIDALTSAGITGPEVDEARASLVIDDIGTDFARDCLGDTRDAMVSDGVPHPVIELAVSTAFLAWTMGKPAAEAYWESGGKAPTPPKTQQAGRLPTATPTPQAAATTTQTRASRSGTKRRKRRKGSR